MIEKCNCIEVLNITNTGIWKLCLDEPYEIQCQKVRELMDIIDAEPKKVTKVALAC